MNKEIFEPSAEFLQELGRATMHAQAMEEMLVSWFAALHLSELEPQESLRSLMDAKYKQTLGIVIKDLSLKAALPETITEILRTALEARNWLTHRFFREFGMAALDTEVEAAAIKKLKECSGLFQALSNECFRMVMVLSISNGESDLEIRESMLKCQKEEVKRLLDRYKG